MKFNFRKVASAFASAVMLSSTVGFAAAASWPAPFVTDGVANAAIVYPSAAAASPTDAVAALSIQTALDAFVDAEDTNTTFTGDGWVVEDGKDLLEINEPISGVETSLDSEHLDILADGAITNEKGTFDYEQKLTFDTATDSSIVKYDENDDDEPGLYFYVDSGNPVATYTLEFSPDLKSDIESDGDLQDIVDKDIMLLGQSYTITRAVNGSSGVELDLMGGAEKTTLSNGESVVIDGKSVSVLVSSGTQAKFTVDGEDSSKLATGETYKFSNGAYLGVTDITYQEYAGGLAQATFFLGGNKLELHDGESVITNGEEIDGTLVTIASTESSADIEISEMEIQMNVTGGTDAHVPVGGKLSETLEDIDLEDLLFGGNWDIVFEGLEDADYETVTLDPSSNNEKYTLKFETVTSDEEISLPLIFVNTTGVYGGDKESVQFILDPQTTIEDDDYFILNNENPATASNDVESCAVQFVSTDWKNDEKDIVKFNVLGEGSATATAEVENATGTYYDIKLCGTEYSFMNTTTANADNYDLKVIGSLASNGYTVAASGTSNASSVSLRTKSNSLITISDTDTINSTAATAPWTVVLSVDDDTKDGDYITLGGYVYSISMDNDATSGELVTTATYNQSLLEDPENEDVSMTILEYGVEITETASDSSEEEIVAKIPTEIVTPIVKIMEGAVTVGGSTGSAISYVKDSEVANVASKNLIVVAGSCINTAAAKLLGSEDPICEAAFTTATTVGEGGYIIKVFDNPWDSGDKVAMLVAGYSAADTTRAANDVKDGLTGDIAVGFSVLNPTVA